MDKQDQTYWNPWLETLDSDQLMAIELKNLRHLLHFAKNHSVLYRERYKDIFPEDIKGIADVQKLPLIDKEILRRAQEDKEPYPYGELLGVDLKSVTDFRQTSGTTGRPVYVPESYESWQWRVEVWCHILWMAGFRETDRVFLPFGYNVYVAFWEGHYAAEKLGCEVVPGGASIRRDASAKSGSAGHGPPEYPHLRPASGGVGSEEGSRSQKPWHPKDALRRRTPAPATRRRLEQLWGAEVYDHIGGTEPCAWGAMCRERKASI